MKNKIFVGLSVIFLFAVCLYALNLKYEQKKQESYETKLYKNFCDTQKEELKQAEYSKKYNVYKEIDFSSKRVSLSAGSTLQFYINSKTMYTKLTGISNLTLRGTLKVLVNENISLSAGDEIKLWDANSTTIGGTVEYDLASPGNGLEWDTSSIEDGILRVQAGTGIGMLENDVVSNFELFTVSGVKLGVVTCHREELVNEIKKQGLGTGTYMIRMKTTNGSIVEKIQISE